jgi:RimJ/RimL family protein N-acetyltransferase
MFEYAKFAVWQIYCIMKIPAKIAVNKDQELALRRFTLDDVDDLAQAANYAEIAIHLRDSFPYPYERKDAVSWLNFLQSGLEEVWAITLTGKIVGAIGLTQQADVNRYNMELGYWLTPPMHHQGIMSQVIPVLLDKVWRYSDIKRVYAVVFEVNTNSAHLLEKCKFIKEGHFKKSAYKLDCWLDELIYAIHRPEIMGCIEQ